MIKAAFDILLLVPEFGKSSIALFALTLLRWFLLEIKPDKRSFRNCVQKKYFFKQLFFLSRKGKLLFSRGALVL